MPKNNMIQKLLGVRPPLVFSCIAAVVFSSAAIILAATEYGNSLSGIIVYTVYVCAAISLSLAVLAIICFVKCKNPKARLSEALHKNKYTAKFSDDIAYRAMVTNGTSFVGNIIFASVKGLAGLFSASWWLFTLSVYNLVFSLSRFLLLRAGIRLNKNSDSESKVLHEWQAYRICGIFMLVITVALQGVVVLILKKGNTFEYRGWLIFAVAAIDFYNLTAAIVYMLKNRKKHSPIIVAIRANGFAASLVSMLSLQTAMFASFGNSATDEFQNLMNLLTGTAVCLILSTTGIYMVTKSSGKIKCCENNDKHI